MIILVKCLFKMLLMQVPDTRLLPRFVSPLKAMHVNMPFQENYWNIFACIDLHLERQY